MIVSSMNIHRRLMNTIKLVPFAPVMKFGWSKDDKYYDNSLDNSNLKLVF